MRSQPEYLALLQRLRPRTAFVEFVAHDADLADSLSDRLAPFDPERTIGVGPRPGYARPEPRAVLLRCRYHRDLFALLRSFDGFFDYEESPRGDRVTLTELGNADVSFFEESGRLLCYTVTHEGLVFVRTGLR